MCLFSCEAALAGEFVDTIFILARTAPRISFFSALSEAILCSKSKSILDRRFNLVKHGIQTNWSVSILMDLSLVDFLLEMLGKKLTAAV